MPQLITYDDASIREDLIDVVTNISPRETPLLSDLPMGERATSTLHQWTTDTFAGYTDEAVQEGNAFTAVDLTQPVRSTNGTQIFMDPIQVSGTEVAVKGVVEPFTYQTQKTLIQHAKNIELGLMAGSTASGNSGVARRMQGVINSITTNNTARASGTSLTVTEFGDIMQGIWNSTSQVATMVFVGGTLKRAITAFTTAITRFEAADDKRLTTPISVYESDFGVHKIYLHRCVPDVANGRGIVAINPDYNRKSWLRPTSVQPLPPDGDRRRAQVISELTLEYRGQQSGAYRVGYM
jgi:hypothetical protein